MAPRAAYDGLADWYDQWIHEGSPESSEAARIIEALLGPGPGRCLDLGCGGGAFIPTIIELGWDVVGVDISADQLRFARTRVGDRAELVHADATDLPFEDESFHAVVGALVSTDVEPFEALASEGARVLRSGGRFVHLGTHPCFVGPFTGVSEDGRRWIRPGYHERGRHFGSPAFRAGGLREKLGTVHVPLGDVLNALLAAGLVIEHVVESTEDPPILFGLRATRGPR